MTIQMKAAEQYVSVVDFFQPVIRYISFSLFFPNPRVFVVVVIIKPATSAKRREEKARFSYFA